MIYFARASVSGLIKIGFTAGDPAKRLGALVTGSGPVDLVATLEGDITLERALHARFADDRVHGEWFALSDDAIAEVVDAFQARRATGAIVKRGDIYHARFKIDGKTFSESTGSRDKREARQYLARRIGEIRLGAPQQPRRKKYAPKPMSARDEIEALKKQLERQDEQHAVALTVRRAMPTARVELLGVPAEGIADVLNGIAQRAYQRDTYGPEHSVWAAAADAARAAFDEWRAAMEVASGPITYRARNAPEELAREQEQDDRARPGEE